MNASTFVERVFTGNLIPVLLHHKIDAELRCAFLTGFSQQDYVTVERHLETVQQQKDFQIGRVHGFIVNRSATEQIAVFLNGRKRVHGPFIALHANHVQVSHQQQRLLFAVALQTSHNVAASWRRFINLRRNPLRREHPFDVFRCLDLIAGRITGINLYQLRKEMQGFIMGFGKVRRCLCERAGRKEKSCNGGNKTRLE